MAANTQARGTTSATDPSGVGATGGATHGGVTQQVDTHGNIIASSDPSTHNNATPTEKLKGDVKGAIHGTVGSIQGATGAMLRNKGMEEKGMQKMSEEDQRLGAKRGVPPMGSDTRNTTADASDPAAQSALGGKQV